MRYMSSLVASFVLCGSVLAAGGGHITQIDEALTKSVKAGKPSLFLVSDLDTCEQCKTIRQTLLGSKEVMAVAKDSFLFSEIHLVEAQLSEALFTEFLDFQMNSGLLAKDLPALLIFDSDGRHIHSMSLGGVDMSHPEFIQRLKDTAFLSNKISDSISKLKKIIVDPKTAEQKRQNALIVLFSIFDSVAIRSGSAWGWGDEVELLVAKGGDDLASMVSADLILREVKMQHELDHDIDRGITVMRSFLEQNPRDVVLVQGVSLLLAQSYILRVQPAIAREVLVESIALDPKSELAASAQKLIDLIDFSNK